MKKAIGSLCPPAFGGAIKFWPKLPKLLRENCKNFLACHCNVEFVVIHFHANYPPINIYPTKALLKMSTVPWDILVPELSGHFRSTSWTFDPFKVQTLNLLEKVEDVWRSLMHPSKRKGLLWKTLGWYLINLVFPSRRFSLHQNNLFNWHLDWKSIVLPASSSDLHFGKRKVTCKLLPIPPLTNGPHVLRSNI